MASLETRSSEVGYLDLQHNNQTVYCILTSGSSVYQSATNSAIIKLDKHDTVKAVLPGPEYFVYSNPKEVFTTFSGQLVSLT